LPIGFIGQIQKDCFEKLKYFRRDIDTEKIIGSYSSV
jgi:hypothetical protein